MSAAGFYAVYSLSREGDLVCQSAVLNGDQGCHDLSGACRVPLFVDTLGVEYLPCLCVHKNGGFRSYLRACGPPRKRIGLDFPVITVRRRIWILWCLGGICRYVWVGRGGIWVGCCGIWICCGSVLVSRCLRCVLGSSVY